MNLLQRGQKEGCSLQADPVEARLGSELGCSVLVLFTLDCRTFYVVGYPALSPLHPSWLYDTKTVSVHSVPEG